MSKKYLWLFGVIFGLVSIALGARFWWMCGVVAEAAEKNNVNESLALVTGIASLLIASLVACTAMHVSSAMQIKEYELECKKLDAAKEAEDKDKEIKQSEEELRKSREHEIQMATLQSKASTIVVEVQS